MDIKHLHDVKINFVTRFTLTPRVSAKPFTSRTLEQTIDPKNYQGGSQAGYDSQKNQRTDSDIYIMVLKIIGKSK